MIHRSFSPSRIPFQAASMHGRVFAEIERWNAMPSVMANNCYSFAVGHMFQDDGYLDRPRPGETGGRWLRLPAISKETLVEALAADGILKLRPDDGYVAKRDGHIIAAVIDPGHAYHFYRRFSDGSWWHKPNQLDRVTHCDGSGTEIVDPRTADKEYGYRSYSEFVGFFLVPARGVTLCTPRRVPQDG